MAKTIADAFNLFRSNLEISDYQQEKVAARQKSVRNALANGHLTIKDDFLTGSYSKRTMVRPMADNDIDMFVVFHEQHAANYHGKPNGPQSIIEYVRSTIKPTYPFTGTRADGQALVLKFNDGIHVDVVPAFLSTANHYLIPNLNSAGTPWIHTNPKLQAFWLSTANKNSGGMLVPFVKMVKYWNKANNVGLSSFHIEALVLQFFRGKTITSYALASRSFFSQLGTLLNQPTYDPVNVSGRVDTYLDLFKKMQVNAKVSILVKKMPIYPLSFLLPASSSLFSSDQTEINGWRTFYGGLFPAYG